MSTVLGHLWVAKDDKNVTYLKGYLFLTVKGRKRVYITKIIKNKNKTLPTHHDFTAYDFTVGKPKMKPPTK
jgi:hypothetical protein